MDAAGLLAVFGAVAAVLSIGGAVVIGLRGRALEEDLKRVRASNEDLDADLARKDRRIHDLEVEQGHLKDANDRMSAALSRIGEQAASGADIRDLAEALREASGLARDHDREASARHAATIRALREVRTEQAAVKAALEARKDDQ